jgi:hypothetical protein
VSASELRAADQAGSGAHPPPAAGQGVRAVLADLFPAPAEPARRAGLARWALLLVQVAALIAVLLAGWATDFRYPVRRFAGPASAWELTADKWLRHCQHTPAGTITVTFPNWWGTAQLATTFSCSSLRR